MKFKYLIIIFFIILLTGCGKSNLKEISYSDYSEMIKNKETFILEIMQDGCSHCENFKPKLEDISKEYDLKIYYINLKHLKDDESEKLYSKTGTSSTPTVIFYKNGVENTISSRIKGDVSKDRIIQKLIVNGFIDE